MRFVPIGCDVGHSASAVARVLDHRADLVAHEVGDEAVGILVDDRVGDHADEVRAADPPVFFQQRAHFRFGFAGRGVELRAARMRLDLQIAKACAHAETVVLPMSGIVRLEGLDEFRIERCRCTPVR